MGLLTIVADGLDKERGGGERPESRRFAAKTHHH